MNRLPDLYRAGCGHRAFLLVKIKAGLLPLQPQIINQGPSTGFKVLHTILVTDLMEAPCKLVAPVRHQRTVAHMVPRHLLLIVGMQVGISK